MKKRTFTIVKAVPGDLGNRCVYCKMSAEIISLFAG